MQNTQMNLEQMQQQALQFYQSGQLEQAESSFRNILESYPKEPASYINLGGVLFNQGRIDDAVEVLGDGLNQFPENIEILSAYGTGLSAQGHVAQSLEYANKAIALAPEECSVYLSLANIQQQNGQLDAAITACKKAIELNSDLPQCYFVLGNLLKANDAIDDAIETFKVLIDKTPQWLPAFMQLGELLIDKSHYDEALDIYKKAQAIAPNTYEVYERMGMIHHVCNRYDEAEVQFRMSLKKNDQNADSHVLLGNVLRDLGRESEAVESYQKALKISPDNPIAKKNINAFHQGKISKWHFDMLSDFARNDAYDNAINAAITDSQTVLEIGTGAGLLSMMAVRAGAKKVHTCEMVPELFEVAQKVVADNDMEDQIDIINKRSTKLQVGVDLPEKADVLISEILDAGLLGEGVLPTLRHALENLVQPDAIVLPKAANVYGMLIESEFLKRANPLTDISGFDLSAFNEYKSDNDYISLALDKTPHRVLSEVFPVLSIDFKNVPSEASPEKPHIYKHPVTVTQSGTVHCVIFWFELYVDEQNSFSTGIGGESFHWQQAAQFFEQERAVQEGETLDVQVEQSDVRISFKLN